MLTEKNLGCVFVFYREKNVLVPWLENDFAGVDLCSSEGFYRLKKMNSKTNRVLPVLSDFWRNKWMLSSHFKGQ